VDEGVLMKSIFASVDLGGTNVSAALADETGRIIAEAKEPTLSHEGPPAVLGRIATLLGRLARQSGVQPVALGMGVPGLADLANGVTTFLPNLPTQWREVPVRATLEPKLGYPVYLLNDARAAALGELTFGSGRDAQTMIFFTLGTGIGGGIVVERQLRLGPLGAAGEIGHQTILPDGPLCGCGNRGCLEALASGPAITAEGVRLLLSGNAPKLHELCEGQVEKVSPRTMGAAARAGDAGVAAAIRRAAEWLGIGAANLVVALHPDLIVLGGGVAELGELLIGPMRETLQRRVGMIPTQAIRIERSALGDKAGLLGGIALARHGGLKPG
jgi:glucokinase